MIKKYGSFFIRLWVVLAAAGMVCVLLLCLAYLIPFPLERREELLSELNEEGRFPRANIHNKPADDSNFHSFYPDVLDYATDENMIRISTLQRKEGESVLVQAMRCSQFLEEGYEYPRYWHGYVIILRPLLRVFRLDEIRTLGMGLQILLVGILGILIFRRTGGSLGHVCMVFTFYFLGMPSAMGEAFQFYNILLISVLASILLLARREFFARDLRYLYVFSISGILTAFFDFLTFPLLSWGIPAILFIVAEEEEKQPVYYVRRVIESGIAWVVSYGSFWLLKMLISSLVLRENVLKNGAESVLFRASGNGFEDRIHGVLINWKHYAYLPFAIILGVWLIVLLYRFIFCEWEKNSKFLAFFLIMCSSEIWYFVLAQHTSMHHIFTYRIFLVAVMAWMAVILGTGKRENKKTGHVLAKLCLVFGIGILSSGFYFFLRDDLWVHNILTDSREEIVPAGTVIEQNFTPRQDSLCLVSFILQCQDPAGEYKISVMDGRNVIYQEVIPAAQYNGGNYLRYPFRWKLSKQKSYQIRIELNCSEPVSVWVTEGNELPLEELGELMFDGKRIQGQLLFGLSYWCPPQGIFMRFFFTASILGLLLTVILVFGLTSQDDLHIMRVKRFSNGSK